jgi:hypothetical protein
MSSTAIELIRTVEANGGRLSVEGDKLVIEPREAAEPLVDELRAHKAQIIALIQSPTHDPEAWMEDFHRWALDRCVYRDRCFGGIGALWSDFGEWAVGHSSVPCTRRTFELLLTDFGFFFAEGMIYGLILKADLWALDARPEASEQPMNSRSTRKSPRNLCRKEN